MLMHTLRILTPGARPGARSGMGIGILFLCLSPGNLLCVTLKIIGGCFSSQACHCTG